MRVKTFKTSDIYLASSLVSWSFPIIKTTKDDSKVFFHFGTERVPMIGGDGWTIDKAVKAYWDKSLELPPLDIFNSFKELKNRIYNQ